jgi:hypothetical protein
MIDGYTKADPPTQKKLPVEVDVPELLIEMGYGKSGSIQLQADGDLSLIEFYYLLRIGEYTVKRQRDRSKRATKQTVQFKLEDVTFFKTDKNGILRCLPRNAQHSLIMTAESATLKLDNQKNGWKGVCVHQEANGEAFNCPVKALARRVIHLRENGGETKTLLSAVYMLVPKLEWPLNRYGDSPIWNIDKSLPKPILGSLFQYGVPVLNAVPIWGRLGTKP